MKEPRLEPCVDCDKQDCGATVILASVENKKFDQEADCLDLICPACRLRLSISIYKLKWLDVNEHELARGYFGNGF